MFEWNSHVIIYNAYLYMRNYSIVDTLCNQEELEIKIALQLFE